MFKNKRNLFVCVITMILVLIVSGGYYLYEKITTYNGVWDINWGFDVPKPHKIIVVFERSMVQDGDAYIIADYNKKQIDKIKSKSFWKKIDDSNSLWNVETLIYKFKYDIVNSNAFDKDKGHFKKMFSDYPVIFSKGDLYFYKRENGNYFIAILNVDNQRLYTMEWY